MLHPRNEIKEFEKIDRGDPINFCMELLKELMPQFIL